MTVGGTAVLLSSMLHMGFINKAMILVLVLLSLNLLGVHQSTCVMSPSNGAASCSARKKTALIPMELKIKDVVQTYSSRVEL